jgi:hypothetical protein
MQSDDDLSYKSHNVKIRRWSSVLKQRRLGHDAETAITPVMRAGKSLASLIFPPSCVVTVRCRYSTGTDESNRRLASTRLPVLISQNRPFWARVSESGLNILILVLVTVNILVL